MDAFAIGFFCALGWLPVVLAAFLLRSAFSVPLNLGN